MRLFELCALFEDKIDFLRAQNVPSKIPNEVFDQLVGLDPTPNKSYLQWVVNLYTRSQLTSEDFYKVSEYLTNFIKYRSKLANKDINFYKTLPALARALAPYEAVAAPTSKRQVDKQQSIDLIHSGQAEVFYRGPAGLIIIPKTEEASCWFGQGTKWCTAATEADNAFDEYNKDGPLYILMPKGSSKIQIQLETRFIMDTLDDPINVDVARNIPLIVTFFNNLSEEQQRKNALFVIPYLTNPSEEVQRLAVQRRGELIKFINKPSIDVQKLAVQQDGFAIADINNPSEEVQRLAVQQNGFAIGFIIRYRTSEEVRKLAVQQNGLAIKDIRNPSEDVQRLAVQQNCFAIKEIINPSEEVQKLAKLMS